MLENSTVESLIRFLCRSAPTAPRSPSLRVGLLFEDGPREAWLHELAAGLAQIPFLEWVFFSVPAGAPSPSHRLLREYSELARTEARLEFLPPPIRLSVKDQALTTDSAELIRQAKLDVLLAPALGHLHDRCVGLARYGVWSFELEGAPLGSGYYSMFRSFERLSSTFSLGLVRHDEDLRRCIRLETVTPRCQVEFFDRWKAESLRSAAVPVCLELLRIRIGAEGSPGEPVALREPYDSPGAFRSASAFGDRLLLYLESRVKREGRAREWFTVWRRGDGGSLPAEHPGEWHEMTGFPGHQSADPFPFAHGESHFLFYEDVVPPTGHGRLAVAAINGNGAPGEPQVILEKPYHLSYPCVFEHDGEIWMVPESGDNRTVDLYRAEEFPIRWSHTATIAQDVSFVDTTPVYQDGVWYFFTTSLLPGGVMASFLFTAEALTAPWRLHLANPVSLCASASRGAGKIVRRDGKLIRPVQDCSQGYGYAVSLHQITELTPKSFCEKEVATILPTWRRNIIATHTVNSDGEIEVTDARRYKH